MKEGFATVNEVQLLCVTEELNDPRVVVAGVNTVASPVASSSSSFALQRVATKVRGDELIVYLDTATNCCKPAKPS